MKKKKKIVSKKVEPKAAPEKTTETKNIERLRQVSDDTMVPMTHERRSNRSMDA
jgi:hypothetical protein